MYTVLVSRPAGLAGLCESSSAYILDSSLDHTVSLDIPGRVNVPKWNVSGIDIGLPHNNSKNTTRVLICVCHLGKKLNNRRVRIGSRAMFRSETYLE